MEPVLKYLCSRYLSECESEQPLHAPEERSLRAHLNGT